MSDKQQPQMSFSVEKIYLKDVSYEAPGVPDVWLKSQAPEVGVQIQLSHRALDVQQGAYEVVLTAQVNAKQGDKSVFLVEVHQAGIFHIKGMSGEMLERALEVGCGYVLLPFAREAVNDFVGKGGFPQLLLAPINFDALYEQKRAAMKTPAQGQA